MISSQVTTPTLVQTAGGRTGIVIYDNPNVTNNANPSAYVIYSDQTFSQEARNNLTAVPGAPTGPAAFGAVPGAPDGLGPGA